MVEADRFQAVLEYTASKAAEITKNDLLEEMRRARDGLL